jgi:phosphoglycerate dehydrogenase-like enzyme
MPTTIIVLARGASTAQVKQLQSLADQGDTPLVFKAVDSALPVEQLAAQCAGAPVLVSGNYYEAVALARLLPDLQLYQAMTAGTDWLDVAGLNALGVQISDNNGANAVAVAVAEHAIALILSVYHKLDQQFASVQARNWNQGISDGSFQTLVGKRIGLIGLGRIGSRVAKRLAGWECELVFYDNKDLPANYIQSTGATPLPYDELLQTADVVSLHVPLNRLTRGFFGAREFGLMKQDAIFINTCRGPVVNEKTLIDALTLDNIAGAGLDVTAVEPIQSDNPLLKKDNVVITPYFAARAQQSGHNTFQHVVANAARIARGETPHALVQPV